MTPKRQEDSPEEDFPEERYFPFHNDPTVEFPIHPLENFKQLRIDFSQDLKRKTTLALAIAALRSGSTTLTNAVLSDDTRVVIKCLKSLGYEISLDNERKTITLDDYHGKIREEKDDPVKLRVEDSEMVAWFLPALLALRKSGKYFLDGSVAMRKRSMKGLLEALQKLGCGFSWEDKEWHLPFTMEPHGIKADYVSVNGSSDSAYILSALLLIAPCVAKNGKPFSVEFLGKTCPFVDVTLHVIHDFRGNVEAQGNIYRARGNGYKVQAKELIYELKPTIYANGRVIRYYSFEPEAPYFSILPFLHRGISVEITDSSPLVEEFISKLSTTFRDLLSVKGDPSAIVISKGPSEEGFTTDYNSISGMFLPLVAVAPLLKSPLVITGISEGISDQERTRIETAVKNLKKIADEDDNESNSVVLKNGSLTICPFKLESIRECAKKSLHWHIPVETEDDQDMALSFAVLGTYDLFGDRDPWLSINSKWCRKNALTNFFSLLWDLS